MPWHRMRIGTVYDGGLVHCLYEWFKSERHNWDTQCGIVWGSRNNTNRDLKPALAKKRVTCLVCLAAELSHGARK